MIKSTKIQQDTPDDHVFIVVECSNRPTISIDITNEHHRRSVGIGVDGMGIFGALVDLKELPPKGEANFRYCGMCGEKFQMLSSRAHRCKDGGF